MSIPNAVSSSGSQTDKSLVIGPSDDLPAWAVGRFTREELEQMTVDDNLEGALELKDFLPELEAIVRE